MLETIVLYIDSRPRTGLKIDFANVLESWTNPSGQLANRFLCHRFYSEAIIYFSTLAPCSTHACMKFDLPVWVVPFRCCSFLCISLLNYKDFSALIGVIAETYTICTTTYERPRMDGRQKRYNYWSPRYLSDINSYTFGPPPYPWCLRYLFVAFASLKSQRQHLVLTDFRPLAVAVPHSLLLNRLNRDPMFQHL